MGAIFRLTINPLQTYDKINCLTCLWVNYKIMNKIGCIEIMKTRPIINDLIASNRKRILNFLKPKVVRSKSMALFDFEFQCSMKLPLVLFVVEML